MSVIVILETVAVSLYLTGVSQSSGFVVFVAVVFLFAEIVIGIFLIVSGVRVIKILRDLTTTVNKKNSKIKRMSVLLMFAGGSIIFLVVELLLDIAVTSYWMALLQTIAYGVSTAFICLIFQPERSWKSSTKSNSHSDVKSTSLSVLSQGELAHSETNTVESKA